MSKLEGYSKVAVVNFGGCSKDYRFAIYDDGNDYKIGDLVVLSNNNPNARIKEIIEASKNYGRDITAEVIGKVDVSAYDKRVEQRKEKEKLKKEMEKRKKEIQKKLDDEYYAEMLRKYECM